MKKNIKWYKVANVNDFEEARVKTVVAGAKTIALSLFEGKFCAIDNHCPHQGGPLGEGSIEDGWLRCPWHGYEYHPCTGKPPGNLDDTVLTYPIKIDEEDLRKQVRKRMDGMAFDLQTNLRNKIVIAQKTKKCPVSVKPIADIK
jgi:nitrite reductase/ring-hydroxylating ferredoxin subunit